nr:hypothetical protein [Tanacetum cinerariifolium]GEV85064.1 hypothetical protein [Tanacetum cinerariifolium]
MECWIVGQSLADHAPNYALTAIADVPATDQEETTYIVDIFHATRKLPVETPEQPFIPPATLEYIQPFLKIVFYQGFVDKQKKYVIQYIRLTKLTIADIMSKFESIPKRLEEDYHSIKDDTLLSKSVESTQRTNRTPRATRTPNPADVVQKKKVKQAAGETTSLRKSLKIQIKQQKPSTTTPPPPIFEEQENVVVVEQHILHEDVEKLVERDEESNANEFVNMVLLSDEKDSSNRLEPGSHKENPIKIDDDDDDAKKKEDKKDDDENDDDDHTDHALN